VRSRPRALAVAVAAAVFAGGCGHSAPPPEASASLNGAVARVGTVTLPPSLVGDVARAKGSAARDAMEDLVRDALAAQGSLARGFDRDPAVSWQSTSALARRVPAHLLDAAAAAGPPRADELDLVSVEHAVVMRSANLREEDAIALAAAIRNAVAGARSADDFHTRASAVPHPHAQVIVQPVGPFAADGTAPGGGSLDAGFVAAAFALKTPLETSPIVASPFGWHVIQLVERAPAEARTGAEPGAGSAADRARDLGPAVIRMRARAQLDALLLARTPAAKIEISSAADALMLRATPGP
jgi:hypothetical protein